MTRYYNLALLAASAALLVSCGSGETSSDYSSYGCNVPTNYSDSEVSVGIYASEFDTTEITSANKQQTIYVKATFTKQWSDGNFVFTLKPDSGQYQNEEIHIQATNASKSEQPGFLYNYFYIPPVGQFTGVTQITACIPGVGIGHKKIFLAQ